MANFSDDKFSDKFLKVNFKWPRTDVPLPTRKAAEADLIDCLEKLLSGLGAIRFEVVELETSRDSTRSAIKIKTDCPLPQETLDLLLKTNRD